MFSTQRNRHWPPAEVQHRINRKHPLHDLIADWPLAHLYLSDAPDNTWDYCAPYQISGYVDIDTKDIKGCKNLDQFMPDLVELSFERCECYLRIWQEGPNQRDGAHQHIDFNGTVPSYDLYRRHAPTPQSSIVFVGNPAASEYGPETRYHFTIVIPSEFMSTIRHNRSHLFVDIDVRTWFYVAGDELRTVASPPLDSKRVYMAPGSRRHSVHGDGETFPAPFQPPEYDSHLQFERWGIWRYGNQ